MGNTESYFFRKETIKETIKESNTIENDVKSISVD